MKSAEVLRAELMSLREIVDGNDKSHYGNLDAQTHRVVKTRVELLEWVLDED